MKIYLVLLTFLLLMPFASAMHGSSANFNITVSNINYGTGDAESDNFNMSFSLVDQPVVQVASANFIVGLGFYHSIVEEVEELFSACYYHPDIYLYALIFSVILFIISLCFDKLKVFSGMLLIITSIAIMVNGICAYNDWLTRSFAFVLLGLGLMQLFSIWNIHKEEEEW